MKRYCVLIILILAALPMMGCPKNAGFDISPATTNGPEQPWQAHAINADLGNFVRMAVARIRINGEWMGDGIGYIVEEAVDGEKRNTFWRREVWRALFFPVAGGVEVYPAIISPCHTHLFFLFPNRGVEDLQGNLIVLSGSGGLGHTTRQEIVEPLDDKKLVSDALFRTDFFALHPSPLEKEMLRDHSLNTPEGQLFIEQIKRRWPKIAEIKGSTYTIDPEAVRALSRVTNHASYLDRLISQGGIVIGPTMAAYPIGTAVAAANILFNLGLAANDRKLKGSFFEAVYTGREVGLTYAPVVACAQELMEVWEQSEARVPRGGGTR